MIRGLLLVAILTAAAPAPASPRSAAHVLAFKRANPCPSTGARRGACPGYVVDHVRPLCAGGEDAPSNMAWQTREDALRKDAEERRECRQLRRR